MNTATTSVRIQREPGLLGQTVVLIGGSSGIGLETARRERSEGAEVILVGAEMATGSSERRSKSTRGALPPSTRTIQMPSSGSSTTCKARSTTSW